jgi:hypothetical protein
MNMLPPSLKLHAVTTQNTIILNATAVKISKLKEAGTFIS